MELETHLFIGYSALYSAVERICDFVIKFALQLSTLPNCRVVWP